MLIYVLHTICTSRNHLAGSGNILGTFYNKKTCVEEMKTESLRRKHTVQGKNHLERSLSFKFRTLNLDHSAASGAKIQSSPRTHVKHSLAEQPQLGTHARLYTHPPSSRAARRSETPAEAYASVGRDENPPIWSRRIRAPFAPRFR